MDVYVLVHLILCINYIFIIKWLLQSKKQKRVRWPGESSQFSLEHKSVTIII